MKEIQEKIDAYIAKEGLVMHKMLQNSSYGFFHSQSAVYDTRTVRSYKQACDLSGQGFSLSGSQDIGLIVLNALMK